MTNEFSSQPYTAHPSSAETDSSHRVLRNTYLLLALSMLPTTLGALIGIQFKFSFFPGSPFISFMVFLGIAWGFMWSIERTKNRSAGIALLLGFTFFMGLMLSRLLQVTLGFSNGGTLIALAAAGTGGVMLTMATLASVTKKDFSFLGKFLFIGLVLLLLASVANLFFQIPALMLTLSVISVALFSLYLLHDISRIVTGGETNYITATLAVYLDLYNIFVSLLNLLSFLSGEKE